MWIAKNSITGTTYGKSFNSVYDCQEFIDRKLCVLEYEMQRCFSFEKDVINSLKNRGFFEIIQDGLDEFKKETGIEDDMKVLIEFTLKGKKQKDIDKELHRLACLRWQSNNVIRCYNLEQDRFANGFDF